MALATLYMKNNITGESKQDQDMYSCKALDEVSYKINLKLKPF